MRPATIAKSYSAVATLLYVWMGFSPLIATAAYYLWGDYWPLVTFGLLAVLVVALLVLDAMGGWEYMWRLPPEREEAE